MEGKRKAEFMAVAVQAKKPRSDVVVHAGEKGVVQSVSWCPPHCLGRPGNHIYFFKTSSIKFKVRIV